jgi:hypothetical protein
MKNIKRIIVLLTILSAVGITYALNQLKNLPDVFDFEEEE